MDKGVAGPEIAATQATYGCPKGYEDPYLGTRMTQSASVHGLGTSNWGEVLVSGRNGK